MIAATSLRRSAPRFLRPVVTAAAGHDKAIYSAIGSQASNYLQQVWKNPLTGHSYSFSTAALDDAVVVQTPGTVTKKLRVLNMDTVKNILKELNAVDRNSDGRIDTDELKQLLRKHNSAFTEDEIVEIGELFYAGKSGGSVSFDRFIEAIDRVVQRQESDTVELDESGNPLKLGSCGNEYLFYKSHGNMDWNIELKHTPPETFVDRLAYNAVKGVRLAFDAATGWNGEITPTKVMNRTIYLETIAAVPGMVAAIVRHFKSLRTMQRDGGMIQMFLDEANNERMHLLTFVRMKNPNALFRAAVVGGQFGFGSVFLLAYMISPHFCHRFVGYVEEEACSTYTKIIQAIEEAPEGTELAAWRTQLAPAIGRAYWKLGETGSVLDLMYAVRADEAEHRDVNHLCSSMKPGQINPVFNTEEKLNTMLLKYVQDIMERDPNKPLQHQ
ncbi:hypothetical protein FisN_5Lh031 [Fistulifera solaris]|uniref:EF-hand domain-containing protein n=1 Tax=Fistulifera solaris TaxID=1519565 RepID=A0A1Z5JJ68_FISSO|nr:hypothetical protein FisN_5Lh031 [Fistulifera solaris]|eukprot:GAX14045.1 hypothetical protein FisN_5Lh031 [Fistulifera solaris]